MTINDFSNTLRESLNKKLAGFNPDSDDVVALGTLLTGVRESIRKLKQFVAGYTFSSEQEEIQFFKTTKPAFMAEYVYYKKVLALRLFDAFRDGKAREHNYHTELKKLKNYAARNSNLYTYMMTGATDLDRQYFLRGRMNQDRLDLDEKFSTGFDIKVARIHASVLIRDHIYRKLQETDKYTSKLTWTESKTALIELVYALHAAQVFNKGGTDIRTIAAALEAFFNVSLGNYYRVFQDIKLRKGNTTSFLDQLRQSLLEIVNSANE